MIQNPLFFNLQISLFGFLEFKQYRPQSAACKRNFLNTRDKEPKVLIILTLSDTKLFAYLLDLWRFSFRKTVLLIHIVKVQKTYFNLRHFELLRCT